MIEIKEKNMKNMITLYLQLFIIIDIVILC